jgi:hypothetical protein
MATSVMMTSSQSSSANGNVKKSIRDTTRLLNRPNLPADMRREMERKLAALQGALAEKGNNDLEREMAIKYRMVKFFERKKAMRKLATAQASGNDEAVKAAQLDLAYILHFPKDRKYISLYPKEASSEAVLAQRDAIRKETAEKLALLGAETMLAKVLKAKAADLQDSADEDDEDEDDEDLDSEEDESDDESEGNESEESDDEDNEETGDTDDESDDDDESEGEGEFDSDDDDNSDDEEEEDFDDVDSENGGEFDSEDDEDDDEDDFDSEDGEEDFDSESGSDNEESSESGSDSEGDSEDEESEVEEPSNKKSRRN